MDQLVAYQILLVYRPYSGGWEKLFVADEVSALFCLSASLCQGPRVAAQTV